MTFRSRLLVAGVLLAVAPLAFFGVRARHDVAARLRALDQRRVDGLATVIQEELARQSDAVGARLDRLAEAMAGDNRLRVALRGRGADRAWLLDYAGRAMRLSGLDVLRIQDEDGRVVSSGHFRNEYDVVDPALPAALRRAGDTGALVALPTASGSILALARARAVHIGARDLTLVGGVAVDQAFLDRLARGTGLDVRLLGAPGVRPGPGAAAPDTARDAVAAAPAPDAGAAEHAGSTTPTPGPASVGYVRSVPIPAVNGAGAARVEVRASSEPLEAVLGGLDRWLALTLAAAVAFALLLALLVSARLSRPVATLASKAARLDLDRLNMSFATRRGDEIGTLSRALDRMTARLRASATRAREAERRATIGDMARQVNHDVRNGLIPIRNVVSHLAQLARERPDELAAVFRERRQTLESSVAYLEELAANYARLSPRVERRSCDLNAIIREVARETGEGTRLEPGPGSEPASERASERESEPLTEPPTPAVALDLDPRLPPVEADPVALRRIVENLVVNALESLEDDAGRDGAGRVAVSTRAAGEALVLEVADTGRGMQPDERERIFQDFYTTKARGTGLGLSIVRRLVGDLGGRIGVDSAPGAGSRFTVELPSNPQRGPEAKT